MFPDSQMLSWSPGLRLPAKMRKITLLTGGVLSWGFSLLPQHHGRRICGMELVVVVYVWLQSQCGAKGLLPTPGPVQLP